MIVHIYYLESFAEKFHKQINDIGLTSSITGEIIVEFTREQGNFVTPRGKYALQVYLSQSRFLRVTILDSMIYLYFR